ncbi:COQ9 family protein [Paracoccus sp. p4-l81]|uniref:COQ9 family protein n=1 Tax=unclassified Paracoccus (in: a-proteobacteria) TaxID=2688777 RepID=UPI0035B717FC
MTAHPTPDTTRAALLGAALPHVTFDGWGEDTFQAACRDAGIDVTQARIACPRGAADLAAEYHRRGDRALADWLATTDLSHLRFRDRVAAAVRHRLEIVDPEIVRRGAALLSLPHLAPLGLQLVWDTADTIWTGLGDTSRDANWYSKRAILGTVYTATSVFWMGDDSPGKRDSWDFLDRRIDGVMRFEKTKKQIRDSAVLSTIFAGPIWLAGQIRAPEPRRAPGKVAR